MFKTLAIAFSMFSKIKMPQFVWEEKNMRYMLIVFPFVGVAVAVVMNLFLKLCEIFQFSQVFTAIYCVLVPILVTGGIHLDGFVDTSDAMSSNLDKERKLEILSDPHIGAFGVISLICYFFASFAVFYELNFDFLVKISLFFVFFSSRCISSLTLIKIPKAKKDGLGSLFANTLVKQKVTLFLSVFLILSIAFITYLNVKYAIFLTISCLSVVFYWYKCIIPKFGGTTGDLQGFLVIILEISMFFALVLAQKVM